MLNIIFYYSTENARINKQKERPNSLEKYAFQRVELLSRLGIKQWAFLSKRSGGVDNLQEVAKLFHVHMLLRSMTSIYLGQLQ